MSLRRGGFGVSLAHFDNIVRQLALYSLNGGIGLSLDFRGARLQIRRQFGMIDLRARSIILATCRDHQADDSDMDEDGPPSCGARFEAVDDHVARVGLRPMLAKVRESSLP